MISLILCDDQAVHNSTLSRMLTAAAERARLDVHIALATTSPQEVLAYARDGHAGTSIYFLDICLDEHAPESPLGLDLCRQIQQADPGAYVIYVSAYHQYGMAGFHTHALDFLVKPFSEAELESCLLSAIDEITRRSQSQALQVTAGSRTVLLNQMDILYLSKSREYVCAALADGTCFTWRESLSSLQPRLIPSLFCQVHRAHCVNLRHVREVAWSEGTLLMANGTRIPLSRRCEGNLRTLLSRRKGDA